MAGITEELKKEHFYKGDFIEKNPIKTIQKDSLYFDYVSQESSTLNYIQEMKKIIQK
jgi:hypothetical protein